MAAVSSNARWWVVLPLFLGLAGCGLFEDPTPRQARLLVSGEVGKEVTLVLSQAFDAGINEAGVTEVQVYAADTLVVTLPYDTIVPLVGGSSVGDAKRFFFVATRATEDLADFQVQIYLDNTLRFDRQGTLTAVPYLFAYVFNQLLSSTIEVV